MNEKLPKPTRMRLPELSIFDYSLAPWIVRSTSKGT